MARAISQLDSSVVARAQRGDRQAHADLYEALAPMIFTIARRILAVNALAEDILQETFVEVIRKAGTFRGDVEFAAWVKRIAINKCLMYLRSGWSSRRIATDNIDSIAPASAVNQADEQIALQTALDCLSGTARAVVWLHDVEGYTHREIGRLMGRTTSFSKSQLARAHERLRDLLTEPPEGEAPLCTPVLKTY